jgi:hypothetical protein
VDTSPAIFPSVRFPTNAALCFVVGHLRATKLSLRYECSANRGDGQPYRAVVKSGYVDRGARHPDYQNPMRESQTERTPPTLMSHILVGQVLGGYTRDQMPSNRTRDPDRHQSGSRKLSMQCSVLRAHPLLDLPGQSRVVRQGSLGLRAELDSGDDVLAHGKRETGANMAHAAHVADSLRRWSR